MYAPLTLPFFLTSLRSMSACLGWCLLPDRIVNLMTRIPEVVNYSGDTTENLYWIIHLLKNTYYKDAQKPVSFFQANSSKEMDQNKGLLLFLYLIYFTFTCWIDARVECISGFEQTQVFSLDDISRPVSSGVIQPIGRCQLEAHLQRRPCCPFVEKCHCHRGPAPKHRHDWPVNRRQTIID